MRFRKIDKLEKSKIILITKPTKHKTHNNLRYPTFTKTNGMVHKRRDFSTQESEKSPFKRGYVNQKSIFKNYHLKIISLQKKKCFKVYY